MSCTAVPLVCRSTPRQAGNQGVMVRMQVLKLAALAAKWKEPPRDALDTLVLGTADLKECDKCAAQAFGARRRFPSIAY